MNILKIITGTAFFEHTESYPSEEQALNGQGGTFKDVKISNLKIERTKIKKENDGQQHQNSNKVEG